jgi:hypothetical protein
MDEQFRLTYDKFLSYSQIAKRIFDVTYSVCSFDIQFRRHAEHAIYLSEKLTKLYIAMRIFYALKFKNRYCQGSKWAGAQPRQLSFGPWQLIVKIDEPRQFLALRIDKTSEIFNNFNLWAPASPWKSL